MAKFIYRMQSILDIKQKMEEQARNEFAQARLRLTEEEERLQQLVDRREGYEMQGRVLRESTLDIRELAENKNAIERIKEFIVEQTRRVRTAQAELENARLRLQEAMQESKTQEKLKENAFEEFIREENAKESKEIDELVSYTYGQKKKG